MLILITCVCDQHEHTKSPRNLCHHGFKPLKPPAPWDPVRRPTSCVGPGWRRLGLRATVLTAADKGVDLAALRAVADVHVLPSEHTTTFSNVYTPAGRTQYCYAEEPKGSCRKTPPPPPDPQ